jgi:hypothetical protein
MRHHHLTRGLTVDSQRTYGNVHDLANMIRYSITAYIR